MPPVLRAIVRASLAIFLTALLSAIVYWAFQRVDNAATWANTKELLNIILPAVTALLGSALGYYFDTRGKGAGGPDDSDSD